VEEALLGLRMRLAAWIKYPHLGGAVVSRNFMTLVSEEVLAVFQTDSRGP
jgi:hypothetical protein